MKTILLTGGSGFVGARLAELIKVKYGDSARVILLTSENKNGFTCINHHGYKYETTDLLVNGIDYINAVIHVGGFVPKQANDKHDILKNYSTLANTQYLLSHLPNYPEKFIFCSSVDVYGGSKSDEEYCADRFDEINESSVIQPDDAYSFIKYCCELLIMDWCKRNGIVSHILRLGPLYGAGDKREKFLIGAMVRHAVNGEDLSLYADPNMKRNLLYIDDCCRFIANCLELNKDEGIINVVSCMNPTMMDIVNSIVGVTDNKIGYNLIDGIHTGRDRVFNAEKRKRLLGDEEYTLSEGMRAYYNWIIDSNANVK